MKNMSTNFTASTLIFSHKGNRLTIVDLFKLGKLFPFLRNLWEDNPLIENQNDCIDIRIHNEEHT